MPEGTLHAELVVEDDLAGGATLARASADGHDDQPVYAVVDEPLSKRGAVQYSTVREFCAPWDPRTQGAVVPQRHRHRGRWPVDGDLPLHPSGYDGPSRIDVED
jgi:hypothetical protein